jgi:hypothetical protein
MITRKERPGAKKFHTLSAAAQAATAQATATASATLFQSAARRAVSSSTSRLGLFASLLKQ